jgi:hypothetical protein
MKIISVSLKNTNMSKIPVVSLNCVMAELLELTLWLLHSVHFLLWSNSIVAAPTHLVSLEKSMERKDKCSYIIFFGLKKISKLKKFSYDKNMVMNSSSLCLSKRLDHRMFLKRLRKNLYVFVLRR